MAEYIIVILLMTAGLMLLALELFLVPGFSVPGIGGLLLIGYAIFRASLEYGFAGASIAFVGGVGATILFIKIALNSRAIRVFGLEYSQQKPQETTFRTELPGKTGRAVTTLRPAGTAIIDGVRVDVVTDGEFLPADTEIKVLTVEGMRVVVAAVAPAAHTPNEVNEHSIS